MTWPILLLALGLGLLAAEIFLPSGGLLGTLAVLCLGGSLYLASTGPPATIYRWAGCEAVLIAATWAGAIYGLPRTRLGRRVYLRPPSATDLDDRAVPHLAVAGVGSRGRVLTPLRPSGTIDVGGRRVEAMAESGLIAAGVAVTVIAVRSGRAVVREG